MSLRRFIQDKLTDAQINAINSVAQGTVNYYEASADYTPTETDTVVEYLSGSYTVTLDTPTNNKKYYIINSGSGTITLTGDGINESIYENESFEILFNGTNWIVI